MVRRPSTPAVCLFFRQLAKVNHPQGVSWRSRQGVRARPKRPLPRKPCLALPSRLGGVSVLSCSFIPFHPFTACWTHAGGTLRPQDTRWGLAVPPGNGSPHQFFGLLAAAPAAYLAADQLDQLHTRIPASAAAGARCGETQVSKAQPRAPQNVGCAQAPAPDARHPGPYGRADPSIACGISWRTPKSCCGGSRRKGI